MVRYLIVGSGRTARHFSFYFQALGLPFDSWNRYESPEQLQRCLQKATHVLVLISDSAIENFYRENLKSMNRSDLQFVHFSGALEVEGMISAHPLMTFNQGLYDVETYRQIPFVTTSKKPFPEILPGIPNEAFFLAPENKALYHALCVMSGNFTTLLWQNMTAGLQRLGLPSEIQNVYRKQIFKNLESDSTKALTGPLARKDLTTVVKNDRALQGDPMRKIYRSFVEVYFPEALSELKGDL